MHFVEIFTKSYLKLLSYINLKFEQIIISNINFTLQKIFDKQFTDNLILEHLIKFEQIDRVGKLIESN